MKAGYHNARRPELKRENIDPHAPPEYPSNKANFTQWVCFVDIKIFKT